MPRIAKSGGESAPLKRGRDLMTIIENVEKGIGKKKDPHLMLLSEIGKLSSGIQVIPFNLEGPDLATNLGGLPKGRLVEIYGPESSGKSFLAMCVVAAAQRLKMKAAYLDIEHSMTEEWAKKNGIDVSDIIYGTNFDNGEQALDACFELCRQKLDVVVVDSTAALVPKAELEGSLQNATMAELARMMSKGIRKINDMCGKSGTLVIFINQIRMKAGFVLGNPEDTPGGKALKFYSSMRLDVRAREKIKDKSGKIIAIKSRVKVVKNKIAAPFGEGFFEIYFDPAARTPESVTIKKVIDLAVKVKMVKISKVKPEEGEEDGKQKFVWKDTDGEKTEFIGATNEDFVDWLKGDENYSSFLEQLETECVEAGVEMDDQVLGAIKMASASVEKVEDLPILPPATPEETAEPDPEA